MLYEIPNGLDEIIHIFGSIDDPSFEADNILSFDLPYPLFYMDAEVRRARCHRLLVDNFRQAFTELKNQGLDNVVRSYSGIYARRSIRGQGSHPSTHSWGIAVDLESEKYPLGSDLRFPNEVIAVFAKAGFSYGGDFKSRRDPMHFQYCKGY